MMHPEHGQSRLFKHRHRARPLRTLSQGKAVLLSSASLLTGVWLSIGADDWHWFARSGAMVVVIGILLTSSQIIETGRRHRLRRTPDTGHFQHDYAEGLAQLTFPLLEEKDLWASNLHGLYLLVTGTLVWGFGDLTGSLIKLVIN